jgi:cytochrome b subunit of formate dehydrogenase
MKEDMPGNFGPLGLLKSYLWALIFYAVIAAISGLIVRKNQPEVM